MTNFLENKKNKIIIGIVLGILLLTSTVLIITGKINLKSIMGNTAQGEYTCPEGYTLDGTNCIKTITYNATIAYGNYTCDGIGGTLVGTKCQKASTTHYNCLSGWTKDGTNCVKNARTTYTCGMGTVRGTKCTMNAIKSPYTQEYSCLKGWDLKGTVCLKNATPTYTCTTGTKSGMKCIIKANPTKVCESGWTLVGTYGERCQKDAKRSTYYTCQNGGDLSGKTCTKTETIAATFKKTEILKDIKVSSIKMDKNLEIELNNKKKITIVIEPNNAKNKNVICTSSNVEVAEINNLEINAKKVGKASITCKAQDGSGVLSTVEVSVVNKATTVTCTENQELKNGICVDKETNNNTNNTTNNNTNNNINDNINNNINNNTTQNEESKCPSGYTLNGNICTKKETINATVKYSCSNGYTLSGTQCKKSEIKEPTSTFTCPVGYSKSGNSCYRIDNKNATVSYICSDDYTYNSTSKKCEKTSTIDVTTGGYTCPEGYDLIEGTRECIKVTEVKNTMSCPYTYLDGLCLKIDYQNASTINSCPNGYELKNEKCEGKTTMEAISNYKCSTGYTLNGKTCSRKIVKTVDTNRYCSTGYTLVNNKCQKTITVEANKNYSCQSGYTLSGTVCTRTLTTELK